MISIEVTKEEVEKLNQLADRLSGKLNDVVGDFLKETPTTLGEKHILLAATTAASVELLAKVAGFGVDQYKKAGIEIDVQDHLAQINESLKAALHDSLCQDCNKKEKTTVH